MARAKSAPRNTTAALGFEAKLWLAAEQAAPAPNIAEAEYIDASPESRRGLIFLNTISDAFEEHRAKLVTTQGEESRAFATLRDTLLSKLLSGELSVGADSSTIEATV